MMEQRVRVAFLEASDALVLHQRLPPKALSRRFGKRAPMGLPIRFDLVDPVGEVRRHQIPLLLREHGNVHAAAPAVDRLRHRLNCRG